VTGSEAGAGGCSSCTVAANRRQLKRMFETRRFAGKILCRRHGRCTVERRQDPLVCLEGIGVGAECRTLPCSTPSIGP
jgi:hypothetical protein